MSISESRVESPLALELLARKCEAATEPGFPQNAYLCFRVIGASAPGREDTERHSGCTSGEQRVDGQITRASRALAERCAAESACTTRYSASRMENETLCAQVVARLFCKQTAGSWTPVAIAARFSAKMRLPQLILRHFTLVSSKRIADRELTQNRMFG